MSYSAFLKEVEKGMPATAYLLHAADPFLCREAVDAVRQLVPETERDFNLHIFDLTSGDENIPFERIIETANTVSFFGGRRVTLFVGNLQKLVKKDVERLQSYIGNPLPQSLFVVVHAGQLKSEIRERMGELKAVSLDMRESEIPLWIKQRAALHGLNISSEAIECLMGLVGPDIGLLSSEIEKIALIGKERISAGDITDIVTRERLYSVFDLTDALRKGNADKVFGIYKTLKETVDDFSLIGALNWQYARLLRAGITQQENEYFLRIFECLNSADTEIKSSGRTYPVEYLLVRLLRLQK
ncbi:MAG: DNA polymerase III subunit delta [Nitrospirota bacterium]